MGKHTELPWCIPAGPQNGFIICAGNDPEKPGDILMVVSTPRGRSRVLTDADVNDNTAFIVKAVNSHDALVKALEVFLGHDERFQVSVGGNPIAVERMLANAREALAKATA